MKTHALMVILLGAIALLVAALVPPGGATAQPQPTMVLSPSGGPCDGAVEVTGQDFPPNTPIALGLTVHPLGPAFDPATLTRLTGLASAVTDGNGHFAATTTLGFLGCEAASLDGFGPVSGQVWVVADLAQPLQGHAPGLLAEAPYFYTTRRVAEPGPMLTISPSTGECDATLQVTGQHVPSASQVVVYLGNPGSEGAIATLGAPATSSSGDFSAAVSLGPVGCDAAALDASGKAPGDPHELFICVDIPSTPFPPGLTCATYAYTTTVPAGAASPSALPSAGQGGTSPRMDIRPLAMVAALLGVLLLVGGLVAARRRSS